MDFYKNYGSSESRREELISKIEAAVNDLTLEELEALHYDMMTKNYIREVLKINHQEVRGIC